MGDGRRPFILVLAGVNGAGKSSVGGGLLQEHGLEWFNPDSYARGKQCIHPAGRAGLLQHGDPLLECAVQCVQC
ncbi:MAG: hypothetical protein EOO29_42925, partial [Comamonadaceae bacterium]